MSRREGAKRLAAAISLSVFIFAQSACARRNNALKARADQIITTHGDPFLIVGTRRALVLNDTSAAKLEGTPYSFASETSLAVTRSEGQKKILPIVFYAAPSELLMAGLTLADAGDPIETTYLNSTCNGEPICPSPDCTAAGKSGQQFKKDKPQAGVKGCKRKDDGSKCTNKYDDDNKACERQLYTDNKCTVKQGDAMDQGGHRCN